MGKLGPTAGRLRRLGAVAAALVLGACELPTFGAPDPVEESGRRILSLWQGAVLAAAAVGALVWALIAYAVVRYRRRDDDVPSQARENVPLEVLYTAVPLVIVAVLFGVTVATEEKVTETVDHPDVVVEVTGFQWQWQFRYPGEGVTVTGTLGRPPTMVLPVGRTVRLNLVSRDVAHAFWVPRFLSKRDLIPGVRNEIDVTVEEQGRWVGRCAEFCGIDHYRMNFAVRAVDEREYRAWLDRQRGAGGTTTTTTVVPPGAGGPGPSVPPGRAGT